MAVLAIGGSAADQVQFDLRDALAAKRNLAVLAGGLTDVERKALVTVRRRLLTEAKNDIRTEYNIKAGRIADDLSVQQTAWGLRLTGKFKGIGLMQFGARQTAKGVTSAVFKGQRSLRPSAFITTLPGGGRHVMQRTGGPKRIMKMGRYEGKKREPIKTEYGATAAQMLRKGDRPQRLADYAAGILGAEMHRLLGYLINDNKE